MSSRSPKKSPLISRIENLPVDTQLLLIEKLSYKSLKNLCSSSRYFADLCRHEHVKKILKRKYEEKHTKYLYYLKINKKEKAMIIKPFEKESEKILNVYHLVEKTAIFGAFLIITNKKISESSIKPLKYRGEKYILQIPNQYYNSSMDGVQDSHTKNWYVLSNTYDTSEFSYKKNHPFYPNNAQKREEGWAVLYFEKEVSKQYFKKYLQGLHS